MSKRKRLSDGQMLKRALVALEKMQAKLEASERAKQEPIAIVGMGCRFPGGADDPEAFWQLLRDGMDAVREVPANRWERRNDFSRLGPARYGGFIEQFDEFDAHFFSISPREAVSLDPQQRLLLEVSWEALEHAGLAPDQLSSRSGVFIGIYGMDYFQLLTRGDAKVDAYLSTGNSHSAASGRLSYLLGLQGPSLAVDTACSSSLVAVHLAVTSLRNGECDLALTGGVHQILSPQLSMAFSEARMLASDGRCKTFDASADGFVRGEGCGMIVLKRLSDAQRDGDHILALIRGSAVNQDGRTSGLTVPNGPSQQAVIRQALENGGVKPSQVSYIEAHGTGTSLGDPIEVGALGAVFGERSSDLLIGSLKTNMGHLEAAAGIAGLIKVVLSLQHGEIPPHLHFNKPSPYIAWDDLPISVPTELTAWPALTSPIAGVSSFGLSGTNAHVVLEEAADLSEQIGSPGVDSRPYHLFTLSAKSEKALTELAARYERHLADHALSVPDLCFTANTGRAHFYHRLAIIASSKDDLREKLAGCMANDVNQESKGIFSGQARQDRRPKVAFLFTGQGSQYIGMGQQLYETQPIFRQTLDRCADILQNYLEIPLLSVLYPEHIEHGFVENRIHETAYTQPALFALEYALAELWKSWGIMPDVVMGHSVGEYVAACVAGVLSLDDALKLVAERGRLMQALPRNGQMVAVLADEARVAAAIKNVPLVSIAAINTYPAESGGPQRIVISGANAGIERVVAELEAEGVKTRQLAVSHAFHSPLMEPILADFEALAQQISFYSPSGNRKGLHSGNRKGLPLLVSNVTGELVGDAVATAEYWSNHIRQPVRFAAGLETLIEMGVSAFLEIGPKPTLLSISRQSLANAAQAPQAPLLLPSLRPGKEWEQLLTSLADLYVHGYEVDWRGFDQAYARRRVVLPTYPFQRERYWIENRALHASQSNSPSASLLSSASHPLLGQKIRSALKQIQFESLVGQTSPAFLATHRVFGEVIFPASAFYEMALAAGSEVFKSEQLLLSDVLIRQALILPDDEHKTTQVILTPDEQSRAYEFQVFSLAEDESMEPEWTLHATGKVRGNPLAQRAPMHATRNAGVTTVDLSSWEAEPYEEVKVAKQGQHAPEQPMLALPTVEKLIFPKSPGEPVARSLIRAKIRVPSALIASDYHLHPLLLNTCLELLAMAFDESEAQIYLQVGLEQLRLYGQATPHIWAEGKVLPSDDQALKTATLSLFGEDGRVIAELEGLQFKRVTYSALAGGERWRNWLYEIQWLPKYIWTGSDDLSRSGPGTTKVVTTSHSHYFPTPAEIEAVLRPQLAEVMASVSSINDYEQALIQLEGLSVTYTLNAFEQLGVTLKAGARIRAAGLANRLGVVDKYHALVTRLLEMLADAGVLREILSYAGREEGLAWEIHQVPDAQTRPTALPDGAAAAEATLLARCGPHLAQVLRGESDPLQFLFPDGDLSTTTQLYEESPGLQVMNQVLQKALLSALSRLPAGRGVRVLEIGAGTGGTTSYLLPHLDPERTEYLFTDIGPLFLSKAQEKFRDYPFVRYQVLDIENDPVSQGFNEHQYDLIVAANVLHATKDLQVTCTHIHRLLAPGGMLLLLEKTTRQGWVDLTFGLTEGWWRFAEGKRASRSAVRRALPLRTDYPLLTASQWLQLLPEVGFQDAQNMLPDAQVESLLSQSAIIVAQASPKEREEPLKALGGGKKWLILAERASSPSGMGQQLASLLRARGSECTLVFLGQSYQRVARHEVQIANHVTDFSKLLRAVPDVDGIIHCWSLETQVPLALPELEAASELVCGSALHLVQALASFPTPPKLWFVTQGAQAVMSDSISVTGLIHSTLWGLGKTIALEHPEFDCTLVDLDPDDASPAKVLFEAIHSSDSEKQVAFRKEIRYVPRLRRKTLSSPQPPSTSSSSGHGLPLRSDSTYLITGGFGGMGQLVSQWMVEQGARHLVLMGRRGAASVAAKESVKKLEQAGVQVMVAQADVSLPQDVGGVLAKIEHSMPPLRGIMHAAGIFEDRLLQNHQWDLFANVFAPKVQGSWTLHLLTQQIPLDFFVLFSSAASMLGASGLGNYVAANAFLDALAHYRRTKGLPALSINWGAWANVGMAQAVGRKRETQWLTQGMNTMPSQEALVVLGQLMQQDVTQVGVGRWNWAHFRQHLPVGSDGLFFSELLPVQTQHDAPKPAAELSHQVSVATQLKEADPSEQQRLLIGYLQSLTAQVLGFALSRRPEAHLSLNDLGVDSLMGLELRNRMRNELEVDMPLQEFMTGATIRELAERLREKLAVNDVASQALPVVKPALDSRYDPFPLTDMQQAYWVGRREGLELGKVAIHVYAEIESQALDIERLSRAWNKLVARHEMLRAVVLPTGQQQILAQVPAYKIEVINLRGLDALAISHQLEAVRNRMSHDVFALDQWPLFELIVSQLDERRARLHISIDGIFLDYRSFQLLFRELMYVYQEPDAYQERLDLSFRDYVLTTLQLQESKSYQTSLDYWRSRLQTLPPAPELPLAKNPNALTQTVFQRWQAQLDPDTWLRLQKQASKAGVTSSALLLAAYAEVLAVWSKTPRFTMNVPLFNRLALHPQVNQVLGTFSSFTLVEVDHSVEESFLSRARKIQEQLRSGLDHSHVSGVRILREMFQKQGGVAAGSMPIVFTSAPNIEGTVSLPTVFKELGELVTFISQTPQVWIDNQVQYGKDGLFFNWDAVAELFPEGMLSDMFEAYQSLLKQLASHEAWHSIALQLLPQVQLDQRAKMNATEAPIPDELLHTLFTAQLSQRPHQVAVVSSTRTLTYQELYRRANQVGHRLRQLNVRPNQLVAVVMEKGWEQVVAVLAILLSGAAYLPIDPDLPKERLGYFLENGEVQVVLTQSWVDQSLAWPEQIQRITVDKQELAHVDKPALNPVQQAEDLACVIYTSGSTGLPKGVMITHRGVVNAITATNQHFNIGPKDRVLALTPLIHDMSMYDIFGILAAGGTIVMPEGANRRNPARWLELMESQQVTIWNSVPAMMEMLLDYTAARPSSPTFTLARQLPSLRIAFLGGDWIGLTIPERLKAIAQGAQVVSVGGPTETTLWNIWYPVQAVDPTWKSIPYGKPIANTRYYVLNEALSERPVWVPGQLYVAEVGVSPGYWRDEEKTNAKFITHPITGERLYATGDLGRYLPDGNLEFLGRVDFQLKIRGRRIEPGEIEAALSKHPAVHSAVVSAIGEPSSLSSSHKRLVAYIVPERPGHDAPAAREDATEAADYSRLAGVVIEKQSERIEFKLQQLGLRASEPNQAAGARSEFQLPKPEFDNTLRQAYLSRQSYRQFLSEPIPLESFGHLLSGLLQIQLDDAPLPKYRYPSGGGLYPVRTYVYIKPKRVEGMAGGFYYYHPASHRLILTGPSQTVKGVYHGINQPIFAQSAFSLFLVGQMEAITPMYGDLARDFCLLEAGYMGQLLMQEAPKKQIGLCPIGALEFDALRDALGLESSEILLHSFVGGKINPAQSQQWLQPTRQTAPVGPNREQLRHYLSQKLPAYMVPSTYLFLEALPLTANGKVDRKALPAPDPSLPSSGAIGTNVARFDAPKSAPPRTPLEKEVVAIVQEMLGQPIGLHDNFFEQGGDSVMAVQFISRLRNDFSIEYPLRDFFDTPTVERVAKFIEIAQWATQEEQDFGEIDDEEGEI